MHLIRAVLLFIVGLLLLPAILLFLGYRSPAHGHTAASGWSYDPACCDSRDCAQVRVETVRITAQGYEVTLDAGDHFRVSFPRVHAVPFGDARIRRSGDQYYHACIGDREYAQNPERLICLYVPDMLG